MKNEEAKKFVETYQAYYFIISAEKKKEGKENLGISIAHPTEKEYEDEIVKLLNNGEHNIQTIAWKMGGSVSEEGIKTQYHKYSSEVLNHFCKAVNSKKIAIVKNDYPHEDDLRSSYDDLLEIAHNCGLDGYGSVYLISSMFFLSKGNVPIYDYYANVAVKALLQNKCPQDVYVGQAPGKEYHAKENSKKKLAVNMLIEYQDSLARLFSGTDYYKNKGFISRELDRALWVYGHATKRFEG